MGQVKVEYYPALWKLLSVVGVTGAESMEAEETFGGGWPRLWEFVIVTERYGAGEGC